VTPAAQHGVRACVALGIALAILALSPGGALAGTAAVSGSTLTYVAGPAEANDVRVSLESGVYTITDAGAAIGAGSGCNSVDSNRASCPAAGIILLDVQVGEQDDVVSVSASTSTFINGGVGNDTLVGGSGVDFLDGAPGNDTLGGGDAGDVLTGGRGADFLSGGSGAFDTASYHERVNGVIADIGGGANDGNSGDGPAGARDTIESDIENIAGGDGNDLLTGDGGRNSLWGGLGNDTLDGGDGDDSLTGDLGADSLSGGPGGGDAVNYLDSRTTGVTADIGGGADDGNSEDGPSGARDDIRSDVESINGSVYSDVLTGDGDANVLDGSDGHDTLNGLEGQDFLLGSDGGDILRGGANGDFLDGGLDDDSLLGDGGDDTLLQAGNTADGADFLSGGEGIDSADYSFRSTAVVADPGGGRDDGEDANGDGVAEELDEVGRDVEDLIGGSGNDTLTGDGRNNRLEGGAGTDSLNGHGGDDLFVSRDGAADSVACGDGQDSVTADNQDAVSADCEAVARAAVGETGRPAEAQPLQPPVPTPEASSLSAPPPAPLAAANETRRKACAGLKGRKLKRCKALARCKKLRGAKKRHCRALARCKGLKSAKRKSCLKKARRTRRK
jgi:Ca2+-binding RTX toxin-like protein